MFYVWVLGSVLAQALGVDGFAAVPRPSGSLYASNQGVQVKVAESYAQPVDSVGHQAREGAFGVHNRLFIAKPEQLLAGFVCLQAYACRQTKTPYLQGWAMMNHSVAYSPSAPMSVKTRLLALLMTRTKHDKPH
jgi:hypothetical protein